MFTQTSIICNFKTRQLQSDKNQRTILHKQSLFPLNRKAESMGSYDFGPNAELWKNTEQKCGETVE